MPPVHPVIVCEAQVPLVTGGAELHVRGLVDDTAARLAATLGRAGYERARSVTWDGVVERLVGSTSGYGHDC